MRPTVLFSLLCALPMGVAAAQTTARTLSDFRSAEEIARFIRVGVSASQFTSDASGAVLTLEKWQSGDTEWPALILRTNKGLPTNWSAYDCLVLDLRNDGTAPADIALHIKDSRGASVARHFTIPAGSTQALRWPLADLETIDMRHVAETQIFTTRPPAKLVVHFNGLRLENDPEARRAALNGLADSVAASYEKRLGEVKDPEERRIVLREQDASHALQARLRASKERSEQDTIRTQLLNGRDRLTGQIARELADKRMRADFRKIASKASYACGFTTAMEKVCPTDIPFRATVSRTASVSLAGNETESIQLLVLADKQPLQDLRVTAGPLKRADGGKTETLTPKVQIAPVGFVKTVPPSYKVNYIGWYPDPILDFQPRINVKAGEMQPMWVRVTAPPETPPGRYTTTLTVRPANAPPVTLNLQVTVWGFSLPKETHLRTAVSVREPAIQQVYGGTLTETMRQKYYRFLLQYRINPDNIYRTEPPKISDLEKWDRMGMNAFNLIYVVKPADLVAGAPYPPERKAKILADLDTIIPQLKAHGLYSRAYVYGFDEVSSSSYAAMKDVFSAIREKYPDLLLLTTARDATYGEKSGLTMVNGWVPLTPSYDMARAEEARQKGRQVWWYTCIVPQKPFANWFIEYDAIDARSLMGLQSVKYRPDGFLYYAVDRWPHSHKPITSGPYTDWSPESFDRANGDGSFLCAGPDGPLATIRMENIRDGIEDFEYFHLLAEEIEKRKAHPVPGSEAALQQAARALQIGPDLVKDLTHFSKSPEALYAKRAEVAAAILALRASDTHGTKKNRVVTLTGRQPERDGRKALSQ